MPRIIIDQRADDHVIMRLLGRIPNPFDRERVVKIVKKLLTMDAPSEAVGHYSWHVEVGNICWIVFQGTMLRTIISKSQSYPGGTGYKIVGSSLVRG